MKNGIIPPQVRTYEPIDVPFGPLNQIGINRLPGTLVQHMGKRILCNRCSNSWKSRELIKPFLLL